MTVAARLHDQILCDLEAGVLVLPTLPAVALRVREVVDDLDASASDLSDIIVTDPALSAQLIRTVNSPLYRGSEPIDNVQMAVSRLGRNLVRSLVNTMVMKQMFHPTSRALQDHFHLLWQTSTEVAAASRVLAASQPGIRAEDAMLAGLVHKIGSLPILAKVEQTPELGEHPALLTELIDTLCARIGTTILQFWEFPESMITAVSEQGNLQRDVEGAPDLTDVVQAAILQHKVGEGEEEVPSIPAFRKLGIDPQIQVVELDENSEAYAEALALFKF